MRLICAVGAVLSSALHFNRRGDIGLNIGVSGRTYQFSTFDLKEGRARSWAGEYLAEFNQRQLKPNQSFLLYVIPLNQCVPTLTAVKKIWNAIFSLWSFFFIELVQQLACIFPLSKNAAFHKSPLRCFSYSLIKTEHDTFSGGKGTSCVGQSNWHEEDCGDMKCELQDQVWQPVK